MERICAIIGLGLIFITPFIFSGEMLLFGVSMIGMGCTVIVLGYLSLTTRVNKKRLNEIRECVKNVNKD